MPSDGWRVDTDCFICPSVTKTAPQYATTDDKAPMTKDSHLKKRFSILIAIGEWVSFNIIIGLLIFVLCAQAWAQGHHSHHKKDGHSDTGSLTRQPHQGL